MAVDPQAEEGPDVARDQFHGVKRPLLEWREAGIGAVRGVAVEAVIGIGALAEIRDLRRARHCALKWAIVDCRAAEATPILAASSGQLPAVSR